MTHRLRKPRENFTMVPNGLICDPTLSLKAKGAYCLLFSKPDGWNYMEDALIRESADGRDAFRSAVKELISFGWLEKRQVQGEQGRFSHTEWVLSVAGKPVDGSSVAGESPPINTDQNNTEGTRDTPSCPKPENPTKATRRGNPAISLGQFIETTGGLPPAEWGEYANSEHGWTGDRISAVWKQFHRYWTSPDCPKPLKRDWRSTWQNWCDRDAANGRRGGGASKSSDGNLAAAVRGTMDRVFGGAQPDSGVGGGQGSPAAPAEPGGAREPVPDGAIPF